MLFQSLVPTVYVSVARPRCVNSRLESGELAPVHGTPHEPARGPTHHASDSVLREVLRRHLRVQVRDRARRGANPTVHVCPGFRACASKVVLPRARKMGVSPRRAPASPSRRFRGSRAMNAMGTFVWVLWSVWRPKSAFGSIATRRYGGSRARTRIAFVQPTRTPASTPKSSANWPRDPPLLPSPRAWQARRPPSRHRQAPTQGSPSLRGTFPIPEPRSRFPTPVVFRRGCDAEIQRLPSPCAQQRATFGCERWFFKAFPPKPSRPSLVRRDDPHTPDPWRSDPPTSHQAEWRGLGVQQSRGWVHYAIHRPEPHIMLYRCVSRPHDAGGFASWVSRACFSNGSGRRASAVASQRRPAIASPPRWPCPIAGSLRAIHAPTRAPHAARLAHRRDQHFFSRLTIHTHAQAHAELRPAGSHRRRQQG